MAVDLTPVVDSMAKGAVAAIAKRNGHPEPEEHWETMDVYEQRNVRQGMLDLLLPALPVLEKQVDQAVLLAQLADIGQEGGSG